MENKSQNIDAIPSRIIFAFDGQQKGLLGYSYWYIHSEYESHITSGSPDCKSFLIVSHFSKYENPNLKFFINESDYEAVHIFRDKLWRGQ